MHITFRIHPNELDSNFLDSLKALFGSQEVEITVFNTDETEFLLANPANKERLLKAIQYVENGGKLIPVNLVDYE